MKRKRKLISFLCCIAAIGIFVGIYSAGRVQSPVFAAVCGISFAVLSQTDATTSTAVVRLKR